MIFVSDAEGGVTYVSPDWCAFTGRDAASAAAYGWLEAVHPDDRAAAIRFLDKAHAQQGEYTFRYRIQRGDGTYAWVAGGAVPSFGPPGHTFLGYLGSLTEISPSGTELLAAYGTLGRYVPPASPPRPQSSPTLELVADHLLIAHGLIEQDHAKEMLPVLRQALMQAGILLARNLSADELDHRVH